MTDKVVVLVTCSSAEEGRRIAHTLIEERLAACVNVSSPVRSIYHWKGRVTDDQEVLLVIKTARTLFDRVRRTVEHLHSYHVPEVICLPVIDGAPNYLNWLAAALTTEAEPVAPGKPSPRVPGRRPRPGRAKPRGKR